MPPDQAKTTLHFGLAIAVVFLISSLSANAQVSPEMRLPPSFHMFSTFTHGSSNGTSNSSSGYVIGGFLQSPRLWGIETRGSYLHWGSNEFRYDALVGPRIGFHVARFSPYGALLGGEGHPVTRKNGPHSPYESGTGPEWKLLGGVDYYAGHHFNIRLAEISYCRIYAVQPNLSAIDFSAGVAYRLHRWRR